ncbi:hypothetical protein Ngar_c14270 [Candidatus Nitrososphaera gargensis Ga9.2]|uniref:Uncharacterized protein n=1 Tax=Nitrososphaera gargensis (strain Ga9.2) TaxID=1237085 RepID=K0IHI8_NITGG|nr:hypothetical protein [Candidatus Nitrososphaera gargensis]AFU58363.1 hypothetical protein Ngar_c14270 [Candidatus Nitrososphaera gargensis Ga9.2]
MQNQGISTYHVTMDDSDKLGVKPEVLVSMYTAIDAKARQLAPQDFKRELVISQDGRIKSRFYIRVSNRMAPHLIAAIQQQADSESGIGMKSYFYKLQEQLMSQMFTGVKDVIG